MTTQATSSSNLDTIMADPPTYDTAAATSPATDVQPVESKQSNGATKAMQTTTTGYDSSSSNISNSPANEVAGAHSAEDGSTLAGHDRHAHGGHLSNKEAAAGAGAATTGVGAGTAAAMRANMEDDSSSQEDFEGIDTADDEKRRQAKGKEAMSMLSWPMMAVLLCVEAIALGSLSLPGAFAILGMVPGVICSVGLGLVAIWGGLMCGKVYNLAPGTTSFVHAGRVLFRPLGPRWANFGYELFGGAFVLLLVFNYASHTLTGALMWQSITGKDNVCSIVWVGISAILLLLLALPPTFHGATYQGYVDFVSICAAILITMIATGIQANKAPGGLSAVDWTLWPTPGTSFADGFSAIGDIVFAYSFSVVLFSFQTEMKDPLQVDKAVWLVGWAQIAIYTCTGAIIYAFVGSSVESPALLSAPGVVSRIAFGVALPVIFISGSINGAAGARYMHGRIFENSKGSHKYINTVPGWLVWIGLLLITSVIAFIIAEAIPFFSDLLNLISALFISGFSYYIPALFWFCLIRRGSPFARHNLLHCLSAIVAFVVGVVVLVAGLYSSVVNIKSEYSSGSVRSPFTCPALSTSEA